MGFDGMSLCSSILENDLISTFRFWLIDIRNLLTSGSDTHTILLSRIAWNAGYCYKRCFYAVSAYAGF